MQDKLTPDQLQQVIAEVQRLSEQQQSELTSEQVREILQELNLSPELLEQAFVKLQRREKERRELLDILGGLLLSAALLVGFMIGYLPNRLESNSLSQARKTKTQVVNVERKRLTQYRDDGGSLTVIPRNTPIYYRVTLSNLPATGDLGFFCYWIDSNGKIAYQNNSQEIYEGFGRKQVEEQSCRYEFGSGSPTGIWKVQMFLSQNREDRSAAQLFSETTFTLEPAVEY